MRAVNRTNRRRRSGGQSLAEMALLLPFLTVLIAGSAQFGALLYTGITMDTAAREGARVAIIEPKTSLQGSGTCQLYSGSPDLSNPACNAIWNARGLLSPTSSGKMWATITNPTPGSTCTDKNSDGSNASGTTAGNPSDGYIQVEVSYTVPIFVPFIGTLLSDQGSGGSASVRTITSSTEMRVEPCFLTF